MTRVVQLERNGVRRIASVAEPCLRLLTEFSTVYELAQAAMAGKTTLPKLVQHHASSESLDYDSIYRGGSEWRLLLPLDHPHEPARSLVSGTGLTHFGSAKNRQAMHEANGAELTDSMKMFRWGLDGGRPPAGRIGTAPEWFYKGNGTILRAHGEALVIPPFAQDGGEEGEIAGLYLIGADRRPYRIGMAIGNEFSDHCFEKTNYLNLAGSKIRMCSLGPELVMDPEFKSVPGIVTIKRADQILWSKEIRTGEAEMCHSLQNIEHHHFKFETHRRPGDIHVHYFGACALSFGDGVRLAENDIMEVSFEGFGRPLLNPLSADKAPHTLVSVQSLA